MSAAGDVLPPMIIFKGKRALNIQTPPGWIVCVQEKAWMDEELMLRWIKDIYLRHTDKERSLLVMDSFRAHLTDNVKKSLRKGNTVPAIIPGGCTSKIQPLDVSINKPFKGDLRRSWATFILSTAEKVQQADDPSQRLKAVDKETIVLRIQSAVSSLVQKKDLIVKSFKVWGITCKVGGSEDALIRSGVNADSDSEEEFEGFTPEDLVMNLTRELE